MWRIDKLTLTDFKSYKGTHVIPEFHNFQAVIGPNGAGKSNLMDAISFVLGVKVGLLRGSNLKDLIHDDPTMENPPSRAIVELQLKHGNGETKRYSRTILESGSSEYRIDGSVVSEKEYQNTLRDINIDVKARNFLVFQGDVIQVASKSGKELTKMIESICGSDELAKEYDELKARKEKAEEQTLTCFQKKKGMNAEKKQYKQMKEEAERYQELEEELSEQKKKLMLVDIRNYKKGMKKYTDETKEKRTELEELMNQKTEKEQTYQEALNEVRKKIKEENEKKDEIRKLKGERESLKPLEGRIQAKKRLLNDKLRGKEREFKILEMQSSEEKHKIDEFEKQKSEKEERLNELKNKQMVTLNENQQKQFDKQNEKYQTECRDKEIEFNEMKRQIKQDEELIKELGKVENVKLLEEQLDSIKIQVKRYEEGIQKEQEEKKKEEEEAEIIKVRLNEKTENIERLNHELKQVEDQMSELRMNLKENKHERMLNEMVDNLKRLFSKVYGQVNELYTPINKRNGNVISLAIGKYNKAVVVEDTQTAIECLRYVKEQRSRVVLTFLCLKELKTKDFFELDEEIKDIGGSFAIKNIKYNDKYDSVFRFVLNNTLLVDTLDNARKIAFNEYYKHKFRIITSIGSIVEKNSLMIGGITEKSKKKVNVKKGEEEYMSLSSKKQQLEEELKETQNIQITNLEEVQLRVKGHQQRINVLQKNLEEIKKNEEKYLKEKEEMEKKIGGKDVREVKKRIAQNKKHYEQLEEELKEKQEEYFGELNHQIGVENIYLECSERINKEREIEIFNIQQEIDVLKERIKIEEEKNSSTEKMELEKEIYDLKEEIQQEINEKEDEIKQKLERNNTEIENKSGELASVLREMEKLKMNVTDKKKEYEEVENLIKQNQKEQSHAQSMYSKLQVGLDETVRSARMEQIELPIKNNEKETQSTKITMDIVTQSTTYEDVEFDFESIKDIKIKNNEEYNRIRNELIEEINKLENKINGLTPNMKAIDQFNGIVDKLKDINDDFEEVRKEAKNATDAFIEIKNKRTKMFMEAFEHISNTIDPIYKELTRSTKHPLGGTAYLSLENTEEPYLSGLKYSAMPPFKRFHDLEQLSGGEKTIAALALLFAVQSYYPSPFFILDEIDAALDVQNILQVAKYIQKKCGDVQFLVISLKDTLYERADALVGVARDLDKKTSVTYTLDLKEYEL
ncbi:hypothetical protein ENUP19_0180G0032 [Entamoeba nuttalli]|uniref:Structural maintenance of chromosomes protein n=2 Tax=Entamoeba nuttalli TaxID=412467 RepID=K2GBX6_ENTNP|nr:structural maintenance of chromosomes protein [Entamoeba nuttalli P19]EKE40056.1 structural maintenance of chromosomes protein [Entamoeba nuttalli P19]|eukprot:XP_008857614.1 structural maintenance of chromosomes protein [Entamoeba nuttalli P19]